MKFLEMPLIQKLPKAELHIHIEGSLEPELMLMLAKRNAIKLPYQTVADVHQAYHFQDLQSFLNLYYLGMSVLVTQQDFYDLTIAYCQKANAQQVCHAEIFFDPQPHLKRGIQFGTIINGITAALADAQHDFNLTSSLIMCFLRDLSEKSADEILDLAIPFKNKIIAVGLDSAELNNPPQKFASVFKRARQQGYYAVAHAGEEGQAKYIWQALEILQVVRIDHGVHCLADEKLVQRLVDKQIPLTVCPISNVKLKVFASMQNHPIKEMLEKGLCVSINSDDPAYFRGYINENYVEATNALAMTREQVYQIAKNSFQSSLLATEQKQTYLNQLASVYYMSPS